MFLKICALCQSVSFRTAMDTDSISLIGKKKRNGLTFEYYEQRPQLILHFYVFIGFLFGFLIAFITFICYDRSLFRFDDIQKQTSDFQQDFLYTQEQQQLQYENEQLIDKTINDVRILCMVLTCPKYHQERAKHIRATWGQRCNKLIFISSENDMELGAVQVITNDTYQQLWNKTREGFRYIYEHYYETFDWFLKADDDTFVIMENLRYMLSAYYPNTPIYFGHLLIINNESYMSGGAGYVLSREALKRFAVKAYGDDVFCPSAKYDVEDFAMGRCLRNVGCYLGDSKQAFPFDDKMKFFPLNLEAFLEPNANDTISGWLFDMTPTDIKTGIDCCSKYSITFHYIRPVYLYFYEYVIYHLKAFEIFVTRREQPKKLSTLEVHQMFINNSIGNIIYP